MATEQGYNNQLKKGTSQFKTIHSSGSNSFGVISIQKSLYNISATDQSIVSVTDVVGSDGQIQFWNIEITSHGASVGDVLRIISGPAKNFEFEIMQVLNANNIRVFPISSNKPVAANTARIMGWITTRSAESGSPLAESTEAVLTSNFSEITNITNTAASTLSLTNARWILLQADSANTVALRWRMSGTATTTSGMQLASGASVLIRSGGTLSIIAVSAATNQKINVTFGT